MDDAYVTVSEAPAGGAQRLQKLMAVSLVYISHGCGLSAVPQNGKAAVARKMAQVPLFVFDVDLRTVPSVVLDLSVGSQFLSANRRESETSALTRKICDVMEEAKVSIAIGRYDEARLLYSSPLFGADPSPLEERRTIHLGMDLFAEPGTAIQAPIEGVIHTLANNAAPLDYGPLVILQHDAGDAGVFFTLYGHLDKESLARLKTGQRLARGEKFARIGGLRKTAAGHYTPFPNYS